MPRAANKKHLRYHGVSTRTLRAYKQAVNRFFLFCRATFGDLPPSFEQLDYQLSEFINELFQEGDTLSLAGWTISGLKRFFPRCKPQLLTAQQLYKNWCRSHVPQRATPCSWLMVRAMAGAAAQVGRWDLATLLFLGYCFFLRTSEMLRLEVRHARVSTLHGTIVIALVETKSTGFIPSSLSVHDRGLAKVLHGCLRRLPSGGRVFPSHPAAFRNAFQSLVSFVGAGQQGYQPYSLRRGGATHYYQQSGSLSKTVLRGRWKDANTCRL